MGQSLLEVRDLSVSFRSEATEHASGWRQVVDKINFDLHSRETLALVGGSGSGKSVTALAIMRLLDRRQTSIAGGIRLNGVDLVGLAEAQMRSIRGNSISMIFQEPMTSLNPVLPIGRQVEEALLAHKKVEGGDTRRRAIELLDRVRIPSAAARFDDYPHQFSGGQRQRILIAASLACDPEVLIADEPTTALDVTVQAKILNLIRELQSERGMAVLFITHDMGVVAEVADRMIVMHRGEVVETGGVKEIFAAPREAYTRSLLSAVPRLGSMSGQDRPRRFPILDKATGIVTAGRQTIMTVDTIGQPLLQVSSLSKDYAGRKPNFWTKATPVHAVKNVSFDIRAGETVSVVGESGCGKSTTGRTIIRLTDPTSGQILFDGTDLSAIDGAELRRCRSQIQMIFQDPYASLNPRLTIGDALAEPMIAHRKADRQQAVSRVRELLDLVGLDSAVSSRLPQEFSGGQRQRISIARALALNPRLIIADESVSALDVVVKAQIINLLLDLQERLKLSYMFISHDLAVVERLSHRVAVMRAGQIVEIGPRKAIFDSPQHPYTAELLAAAPIPDPAMRDRIRVKNKNTEAGFLDAPKALRQVGQDHFVLM